MPGAVSERIPVAISRESIMSIALAADHFGRTVLGIAGVAFKNLHRYRTAFRIGQ
jgi:hypothetical protein